MSKVSRHHTMVCSALRTSAAVFTRIRRPRRAGRWPQRVRNRSAGGCRSTFALGATPWPRCVGEGPLTTPADVRCGY